MSQKRDAATDGPRRVAKARAFVFKDMPRAILIHFDEDADVGRVPDLPLPLDRFLVRAAFRAEGVGATVTETVPGRWTQALKQATNAERSQRAQQAMAGAAAKAMADQCSDSPALRDRASVFAQKLSVDAELRELRQKIEAASARARTHRVYADGGEFRATEKRLNELRQQSQALQVMLSELSAQDRDSKDRAFFRVAQRVLDRKTFHAILREAQAESKSGQRDE